VPKLLEVDPSVKIIIASSLSRRGAEISLRALELGAVDYMPKPTTRRDIGVEGEFKRELLTKVRSHGGRRDHPNAEDLRIPPVPQALPVRRKIDLRQPSAYRPRIIAVGSSTGGPQALFALLRDLPESLQVPIVITQHMPPTFTTVLAQHVQRLTGRRCEEASNGAALDPACVYIAPGDHHLLVEWTGTRFLGNLVQSPPENHCRPSVDPMLRSLARGPANRVLAIMLTGMGSDGLAGTRQLIEAGGTCLAQDEASSIVWGMPGAVATAGLCAAVLPLTEMASHVVQLFDATVP
jgi:two-component system chemotaxis response regulator CheB